MRSRASRPPIPSREEYGPVGGEPAGAPVDWATVEGWLTDTRYYWLVTARTDGRPHAIPIWAVWVEASLFFRTSPDTVAAKVLAKNPCALAHLESAREVAIVEGRAARVVGVDPSVVDAYESKYRWRIEPNDAGMPYYALAPELVLAWRLPDIRGSASRWRF